MCARDVAKCSCEYDSIEEWPALLSWRLDVVAETIARRHNTDIYRRGVTHRYDDTVASRERHRLAKASDMLTISLDALRLQRLCREATTSGARYAKMLVTNIVSSNVAAYLINNPHFIG